MKMAMSKLLVCVVALAVIGRAWCEGDDARAQEEKFKADRAAADRRIKDTSTMTPAQLDAYKKSEQARKDKEQKANNLAAGAEQAFYEFENSQRKIVLYRDVIIPKAREMLTASETAYQAGTIDFLSLIDAQRKFLEYRLIYEKVMADNAQRLSELEMLTGKEL